MMILRFLLVVIAEVLYTPVRLLALVWALGQSIYYEIKGYKTIKEYWGDMYEGFCRTIGIETYFIRIGTITK